MKSRARVEPKEKKKPTPACKDVDILKSKGSERARVRYYLVGSKDLKAIHVLHEYSFWLLLPTILFIVYNILPYFCRFIFRFPSCTEIHDDYFFNMFDINNRMNIKRIDKAADWSSLKPYRTMVHGRFRHIAGLDTSYYCMDEALELAALWIPSMAVVWLGQLSLTALAVTAWTPSIRSIKVEVLAQQWSWIWVNPCFSVLLFYLFIHLFLTSAV